MSTISQPLELVVILQHEPDSWQGGPGVFKAVALDIEAAKRWIQDEVNGLHESGHLYATGHDADWWIQYGAFSIKPTVVQE